MEAPELFQDSLPLIERLALALCRRARIYGADAEDFVANARLALMENDYAILRGFQGRSSLATYLTIILQRLLADERERAHGRWHASAAAERLGQTGVLLETLLQREGRPLEAALPLVQAIDPTVTLQRAQAMADTFPHRTGRPRPVAVDDVAEVPSVERADDLARAGETRRLSERASDVVRVAFAAMSSEDRVLLRLRFGQGMSIADVSRMMRLPQRPLYRRLESLLRKLRDALAAGGIDAAGAEQLIGVDEALVDFGLAERENDSARRTNANDMPTMQESP